MKVIDFEPLFWFLLQNENDFYIDVNCSYSFIGYTRFIKLNDLEVEHYQSKGSIFLNEFAHDINYYGMNEKYLNRRTNGELENLGFIAIKAFNNSKK
ncbi:MAG: hypothetical protein EOO46_06105 [Flavobacterium sp.]|nr:MAG: hypothetical protein EOO46_06105 [Flavobacterium sp.]